MLAPSRSALAPHTWVALPCAGGDITTTILMLARPMGSTDRAILWVVSSSALAPGTTGVIQLDSGIADTTAKAGMVGRGGAMRVDMSTATFADTKAAAVTWLVDTLEADSMVADSTVAAVSTAVAAKLA